MYIYVLIKHCIFINIIFDLFVLKNIFLSLFCLINWCVRICHGCSAFTGCFNVSSPFSPIIFIIIIFIKFCCCCLYFCCIMIYVFGSSILRLLPFFCCIIMKFIIWETDNSSFSPCFSDFWTKYWSDICLLKLDIERISL